MTTGEQSESPGPAADHYLARVLTERTERDRAERRMLNPGDA